jgi:hypothetical protein
MLVKLKTMMCGPGGNFGIGQIADFCDDQAHALIDGGYAEAVDVPRVVAAATKPEAAILSAPETAAAPHKRGKRGHAA